MKELFDALYSQLSSGGTVCLASVISCSGSAPRGAGAEMAVFEHGGSVGTIGGGSVEHAAMLNALGGMEKASSEIKNYDLSPGDAANLGMICGGKVVVLFEWLRPNDLSTVVFFERLSSAFSGSESLWLARRIENGGVSERALLRESPLCFGQFFPEKELRCLMRQRAVLSPSTPESGGSAYYVEPVFCANRTYIFGGGHVARELVPLLNHLDFEPTIFEERAEFAKKELFPEAREVILGSFAEIDASIKIRPGDRVVIITRGHQGDYEVLRHVLKTEAGYIGCIGSRKKIALTRERLLADGFSPEALLRIHSPIGLAILAETPAEIAVSIAAEMIFFRAESSI